MPDSTNGPQLSLPVRGKILVIDGDGSSRLSEALAAHLRCDTCIAATAADALSLYEANRPDMIVLADYAESTGVKVAKELSTRNCDVPVLIYSSREVFKHDLRGLNLIVDVVHRPDEKGLLSIISTLMGWPIFSG